MTGNVKENTFKMPNCKIDVRTVAVKFKKVKFYSEPC